MNNTYTKCGFSLGWDENCERHPHTAHLSGAEIRAMCNKCKIPILSKRISWNTINAELKYDKRTNTPNGLIHFVNPWSKSGLIFVFGGFHWDIGEMRNL
jgi:hypothetical protein